MDVDRTTWESTLVKNHDENKTYILVKLSESCSNAIQEYSEPKIKFHGTRGAIKFPNGKSYDFSLEQSDNTVECLRQTKNRWEAVGKVACCLHVKGKDDVYQRTRTKMEAAEQEKRKYCTKLLGSPDSESTTTTTAAVSKSATANNSSSASSYYSSSSSNYSTHANHLATSRASKSHLDTSANHKSSSSSTLAPDSILNSSSLAATVQATTVATDIKSSLLASISSASSSSSSTSSSSAAPATIATSNNGNNANSQFNLSKYPDITDVKQMKRYKAEFDKDFEEYQHLHGYLQRIEERFRKLRDTLEQRVEGSQDWESAKEEIFNEYERIKGDSNFHKKRSKYKQLHSKLAHIKEKIFQFKREHRDKFNSRKKRKR
uniref:RNA polymerase II elongation factor ELL n=1 Tax=Aceria tosichella TaxID=561515 RepID=A0A6G1SCW5_9ACAR